MHATIRPYRPEDLDALYGVCVRTAAAGEDLTPSIADPMLPGHLYAGPYGVLEPQSALVAEDIDGVGGYIVGTLDTMSFARTLEREWLPPLRRRYPEGSGPGALDNALIAQLHHPPSPDADIVGRFPAHLHINLLPRMRGLGIGRRLIDRFVDRASRLGGSGVHLGVDPANRAALRFYERLGFDHSPDDTTTSVVLVRRLVAPAAAPNDQAELGPSIC